MNIYAKRARTVSYAAMILMFVLMALLTLATPLLAGMFSHFALSKLQFGSGRKWLAILLFTVLMAGIGYGLTIFINDTARSLPTIIDEAVPQLQLIADKYDAKLPFNDYENLKKFLIDKAELKQLGSAARTVLTHVVLFVVGLVMAVSLFISRRLDLDRHPDSKPDNLYSLCFNEIARQFSSFYQSFSTVMSAQLTISAINTILTSVFVLSAGLPHVFIIVGATFLCGLLPVVGNLISNTIIICIGLTVSPTLALAALIFLVAIHKLEYFLNSKIIGSRIRNPLWLMLLGLVIGERLLGIPGIILAPVALHYLKVELSKINITTLEPTETKS